MFGGCHGIEGIFLGMANIVAMEDGVGMEEE